ncbi:hypothetical protein CAEBREN_09059 [Caenorhabditis brenneri]|uniref:Domain of unknown function WSN domain-containing protein n=1 Tax=Caenorhabditis brenneri TaxID=135651 RepID=G0MSQ1_CAEBE|nr:hypothetical protein CAEBREN_09059 [Caenorhabditis brenneri]
MRLLILLLFCAGTQAVFENSLLTSSPGSAERHGKAYKDAIKTFDALLLAVKTRNTELFYRMHGITKVDKELKELAEQLFELTKDINFIVKSAIPLGDDKIEAEVLISLFGDSQIKKGVLKHSIDSQTGYVIANAPTKEKLQKYIKLVLKALEDSKNK